MDDQPPVIWNPDERDYLRSGKRRRGMVGFLMRISGGRINDERAANYVLLIFALAVFALSILIFLVF